MKKVIIICFLIINTISTSFAVEKSQTGKLFFAYINSPHESGNGVVLTIEEVKRYSNISLIRSKYGQGEALSVGMLISKGIYEIAKLKDFKYFALAREYEKDGYEYQWAVFANDEEKSPIEVCGDECTGEPNKIQKWMEVKMLDFMWKDANPLNGRTIERVKR